MDDKSTSIQSLHQGDDPEVVNQVMQKYNQISDLNRDDQMSMPAQLMPRPQSSGDIMELPPLHPNQQQMEQQFESRDMNQDLYRLNAQDPMLTQQFNQDMKKSRDFIQSQSTVDEGDYDEYEEDEYEEEVYKEPLWRRILNEMRIPFFIILFVFLFFNINFGFDKLLCRYPFFGNANYDCNWKGILLKAILVGVLSYISIRFLRV